MKVVKKQDEQGKLIENLVHFARALRYSGILIGTNQITKASHALICLGFTTKEDLYSTLHSCFVSKPEHMVVFKEIFLLFWKDPRFHDTMMSLMMPNLRGVAEENVPKAGMRRAANSLLGDIAQRKFNQNNIPEGKEQIEIYATGTTSSSDKIKFMDFEQMSPEEISQAKQALSKLNLPIKPIQTRRTKSHSVGTLADWRNTLQKATRTGGELNQIRYRKPKQKYPDLIVLCDISGSMSGYSRMFLHFLHSVANKKGNGWAKVNTFTFGTSLTNITRNLSIKDIDVALESAGKEAADWEGGTQIGECLKAFNYKWARRVLSQGAIVLMITDGLEGGNIDLLEMEIKRIKRNALKLIWLNPLLRWEEFTPKAKGITTILPHVDCLLSAHNVNSIIELVEAINVSGNDGSKERLLQAMVSN